MKTDNYLSLCLEQAAKSPLHYRHGAIVVRGGKVIGHGFNDYRPGFNGGALKHGRIAKTGAFDGDAMMELKKKLKGRQKLQQPEQQQQHTCSTFTPFETNNGGGHTVNQPLSMHSEMMAIYSALNASSTLSSSTFSREKPCFKLPRSDKRKARLRREVLLAYVAAVCEAAISTGQWQVQECGFETATSRPGRFEPSPQSQQQARARQRQQDTAVSQQDKSCVSRKEVSRVSLSREPEREEEEWEEERVPVSVQTVRV